MVSLWVFGEEFNSKRNTCMQHGLRSFGPKTQTQEWLALNYSSANSDVTKLNDRTNRTETLEDEPEEVDTDEKGPYILQSEAEYS